MRQSCDPWAVVHEHRALMRRICNRWARGRDMLADLMQMRAEDSIVRYWSDQWHAPHVFVERRTRETCIEVLYRRQMLRSFTEDALELNPEIAQHEPDPPARIELVDLVDERLREQARERDVLLFDLIYRDGLSWYEALQRCGQSAKSASGNTAHAKGRFLERMRRLFDSPQFNPKIAA